MLCFEASGFAKEAGDAGESDGMSQYLLDALVDSCEIENVGGVIQGLRLKKTL
jgi:hypothetical protein